MTLDQVRPTLQVPLSTLWLIADIAESKGKQELFARQAPQMLKALKETALIQSVESSNRIEGVTVEAARLRPLVLGQAKPRDRSEEEISGYRQALSLIHTNFEVGRVTEDEGHADDSVERAAARVEDGLDIGQALPSLLLDRRADDGS